MGVGGETGVNECDGGDGGDGNRVPKSIRDGQDAYGAGGHQASLPIVGIQMAGTRDACGVAVQVFLGGGGGCDSGMDMGRAPGMDFGASGCEQLCLVLSVPGCLVPVDNGVETGAQGFVTDSLP